MAQLIPYGYCTRKDGSRIPVYFFHKIEEGKTQIHHKPTDEFINIKESYRSLANGRPNKPHRVALEVTEA